MTRPPFDLSVDQRSIQAVAKAVRAEADGKGLRRDLLRELKVTVEPLARDLKVSALSIPSTGMGRSQSLTQAIAASIKPQVRLSGQNTGVAVRAKKVNVRGFSMAARRMNAPSFRHKVYGRETWVTQVGKPGWFDDTTKGRRDEIKRAVLHAVDDLSKRLASRTKGNPHR